jgi:hypothetical protein
MKKLLLAVALMAAFPVFADSPASEASVRELINVTEAKKLLDGVYAQTDGAMKQAMQQAIGNAPVSAEQERLMAEYRAKTVDLLREELSWEKLEPVYIDLYSKTFSQSEIDGMLSFYKSAAGKAVIAKLPLLTNNLMQTMMGSMQTIMPRIQKLTEEYVPKLKAAAGQ